MDTREFEKFQMMAYTVFLVALAYAEDRLTWHDDRQVLGPEDIAHQVVDELGYAPLELKDCLATGYEWITYRFPMGFDVDYQHIRKVVR